MIRRIHVLGLLATMNAVSSGCATAPPAPEAADTRAVAPLPAAPSAESDLTIGSAIADLAVGMVGARYRYGGTDPAEGFDCSGLAFYAYEKAGYRIPRAPQEQFRAAHKIKLGDAGAGDLMFFQDQEKLSHVGIYLGDGLFVHAPANGERVSVASIDAPYYQEHLVAVGRLLPPNL